MREDVKLHEAENAWKPARFAVGETATDEDRKTEQLYKKVRGILNKLTPQKFDTLLGKIKDLQIDNPDRLQGVIDLVFDKAVDEPNFSVAYAKMCKELALMHVSTFILITILLILIGYNTNKILFYLNSVIWISSIFNHFLKYTFINGFCRLIFFFTINTFSKEILVLNFKVEIHLKNRFHHSYQFPIKITC